MPNRAIRAGDNEELTAERRLCPFDTDELAAIVWGSPKIVRRRREILEFVERTPELARSTTDTAFMTRLETVENSYKNTLLMLKYKDQIVEPNAIEEAYYLQSLLIGPQGFPLSLHYTMVVQMLLSNADEEQVGWWLQKAMNREFIGTYAQTEIGHGTNLKKLETTATYDPKTQEFVLNTPTISGTKWWPGGLGKSSNFIMLMAQLVTDGKPQGAHAFMVQIRHPDTHQPMPGVEVGDIGPKYGMYSNDNGYLRFNNVRIPRRNMLMKNAKVHPDGRYEPPSHAKLAYTGMMFIRSVMIHGMGQHLAQAATIAIRYSAIRRQGEILEGKGEVKVLDYTTQQYRLLPQLARSICFMVAGEFIRALYFKNMEQLSSGDTSLMQDLHALSSGLKSCRMACGGHGYSLASGIPQIFAIMVGGCTYEGREHRDTAFEGVSRGLTLRAFDRLTALKSRGVAHELAWNEAHLDLTRASRAHTRTFLSRNFIQKVQAEKNSSIRAILADLLHLYVHYELQDCRADVLEFGLMDSAQLDLSRTELERALKAVRPNAVSIVDAIGFSDRELNSVLGRRDGHVYEEPPRVGQALSPPFEMPNRYIQSYDNKDLTEERKNCPFDTDVLCSRIYGSDLEFVKRRKEILAYVASVPELNRSTTDVSFMSRLEMMENTAKNTVLLWKYKDKCLDPNSPTEFTYLRQWPGNLGKSSSFIVVMAQLITQGKSYGPHGFMVQIRDPKTHEPTPGVTVGDIGPKVGINTNDNGFLRFDHVRIPRRNMLMAFSKVHPDGRYEPPVHPKISYASSMMIHGMAYFLAQAATIVTRYSPTLMQDLHALNSGLKSVVSFQTAQGIEQCRMACGGHGYSKGSGFPQLFGVAVGGCTYEGENMVMLLQLARYLMKLAPQVKSGRSQAAPSELTAYFFDGRHAAKAWWAIQAAFEHLSRRLVLRAHAQLEATKSRGLSPEAAWVKCGVELTKASRAHTRTFLSRKLHSSSELNKYSVLPFHHETIGKMMREVREKHHSKI
ncbi:hypothetical protein M3Y99_01861900 [Aphelenchoides fujianensis]|nr:hypothetical protein M3Y99_01861900 [Aphelenchoides fujianensis]